MSQKTKSSTGAFFNAESGVEWALNKIASGSGNISAAFPTFSGGKCPCPSSGCNIYFLDDEGKVISSDAPLSDVKAVRSVGTQGGETQRAIEAAVAAEGGGGSYTAFGTASCASGWTVAYTGKTTMPFHSSGAAGGVAIGDAFCHQGNTPGWGEESVRIRQVDDPCVVCVK